MLWLADL
jgi:hypothetical protein